MKVIIIGAGIAGCATYLQLKKLLPDSPSITIYEAYDTKGETTSEQRPQGSTHSATLLVGGGIGLAPNGLGVLGRLDETLLREITANGYVTSRSNLKDKNGNLLMSIEPNGTATAGEPAANMHAMACSRHSLWKSLRSRIPDGDIVNKKVLDVTSNAEGRNVVRFADGEDHVEADLVIGADGVHSTVKKALFPDYAGDQYPPNYEGLVGVGGFVPAAEVKEFVEKGSMNFVFGGNGFFGYFFSNSDPNEPHRDSPYHVSDPGDSLAWWSTYEIKECPDRKSLDLKDVARQLRERHAEWQDPVVQSVIKSVKIQNMYPTWTSPPLPTWERDGVVLIGDAAHALPPTSGQGSSQALEDAEAFALFLAHHLGKASNRNDHDASSEHTCLKKVISNAATQYFTLRQPRVTEILEAAQKMQGSKKSMGIVKEYFMYSFMRVMGMFPSLAAKPTRKVIRYNIADEVAKVIAAEG